MNLIDTGPLVALISPREPNHQRIVDWVTSKPLPLSTTHACLTEAMYFLASFGGPAAQAELIDMIATGELVILETSTANLVRARVLMLQYANVPMDYADATLMVAAESGRLKTICTFDSDFRIYRFADGSALEIQPN